MLETRRCYGSVSSPFWGEVCIVGGGLSVEDVPISFLRRQPRLLFVNDSALRLSSLAPDAAVFSLDHNWVRRNRGFLLEFPGEKFVALPLETWPECAAIPGVTYLQWSLAEGLSADPTTICTGGNSGYGALNLAFLKGCRKIYLLGYDMDPAQDDKFFYWIPRFRRAAEQLRERKVEVWNLNPDSHLDAFPKAQISDFSDFRVPGV